MYIAHISEDGLRNQTVYQHNIETAEIAKALGEKRGLQNVGYLVGLLHDIGKVDRFNTYIHNCYDESLKGKKIEKAGDHSTAGGKYIYDRYKNGSTMEQFTASLIAEAILSHHGLNDIVSEDGTCVFEKRVEKSDEIEYDCVLKEIKEHYPELKSIDSYMQSAVDEVTYFIQRMQTKAENCLKEHPEQKKVVKENRMFEVGLLERMILSIVIEADRISTFEFMQNRSHQQITIEDDLWDHLCTTFETYIALFNSNTKLTPLRQQISKECMEFALKPCGIYKLPCPTGSGKTLASMRFALHHSKVHNMERIIYVAPYRAILDQNAMVIKKSLGREDIVLEHHSNVIPEDELKYACMTDDYSNKIILTTMVQLLNTLLDGKTQSIRRFHSLCNSVLIIDEVQSIPIKVVNLFNCIMNYLSSHFRTTVILCTATMPLLDCVDRSIQITPPGNMITNVREQFEAFRRVEVKYEDPDQKYSSEQLKNYIDDRLILANSILVIMNTKAAAEAVYRECLELPKVHNDLEFTIVLLTTNLCPAHRNTILKDITEKLRNKTNEKIICISTQLIEAGVDLSFDVVIRSLAGLDNIAQAAGRCNRNMENAMGHVYIINSAEENLSRLQDIIEGQLATRSVWKEYCKEPKEFDQNILSPKAMNLYYQQFYFRRKDEMDYCLGKKPSIFKLLSYNSEWVQRYTDNTKEAEECNVIRYLPQAFHEAGKSFEAIDADTIGVLVPYGKGREIIATLNSNIKFDEMKRLLREAQLYTVNLYTATQYKLIEENAIYELNKGGILAINEGFYSEEYGVKVTKELEELFV